MPKQWNMGQKQTGLKNIKQNKNNKKWINKGTGGTR